MRLLLLSCLALLSLSAAAPACPALDTELQLRPDAALENTYKLRFINREGEREGVGKERKPEWVEMHWQRDGKEADATHVRAASGMQSKQVEQAGIVALPGEVLSFWATYSVDGTQCDTDTQAYTVPAKKEEKREEHEVAAVREESSKPSCPVIQFDQSLERMPGSDNAYTLEFTNKDAKLNLEYIDLHYKVNDQDEKNVRLGQDFSEQQKSVDQSGIVLAPADRLTYYYTYQVDGRACDTAHFQMIIPGEEKVKATAANANPNAVRPNAPAPNAQTVRGAAMPPRSTLGLACPLIQFDTHMARMPGQAGEYQLTFENKDAHRDLDMLDLHFTVNGGPETNVRLATNLTPDDKIVEATGLALRPNDRVEYYYTYAIQGTACDTEHFQAQAK